jgi:muramoyltetrapeptide carboxypeptidase
VGTFSCDEGDAAEKQSDVSALLDEYLGGLGVPVLAGFPAGHEQYNLTLPMGAPIQLDADARQVKLLENPVGPN